MASHADTRARPRRDHGATRDVVSRKPEAVRKRILAAATSEFIAYGYDGANTNRIAAGFRGAKTTIFRHFTNKRELFLAVVEDAIQKGGQFTGLAEEDCGDAAKWLEAYGTKLLQWLLSDQMVFVANMADYHRREFPEIVELFLRYRCQDHFTLLSEQLRAWTAAGLIACKEPDLDADDFISLLTVRLLNNRKLQGAPLLSDKELRTSARRATELFLYGRARAVSEG